MEDLPAEPQTAVLQTGWRASLYGLATALCFSVSAIFIRYGLAALPSPLLGVTVGMLVVTAAYGLMLLRQRTPVGQFRPSPGILALQVLAGVLVGLATWARWLALGRLSVPTVLLLAPFVVGQALERVNWRVWLGAGLIIAGSLILTRP